MDEWEKIKENIKPLKNKSKTAVASDRLDVNEILDNKAKNQVTKAGYEFDEVEVSDRGELVLGEASRISSASLNKIKKSKPEDVLDLHFMSIEKAKIETKQFIDSNYRKGKRLLLVITGKGLNSAEGALTIKGGFLDWLNADASLKSKILYINHAPQEYGGSGAFIIYLKKFT